ncbi:MAG TPA: tyrosine-type recombinase/integrase [bacterium]|nr:tyrosine-type recombinase/integrase [bacterium]
MKDYLGQLVREGASPEKLKMQVAGIKFLYEVTLDRPSVAVKIPWPKVPHRQPDILSGTEVERLLKSLQSVRAGVVLMTAYGAGLRISEACRLRPEDIDSKRGLIHVRLGKGNKDRHVMLSPRLLGVLRVYWRQGRPEKKSQWLFLGRKAGKSLTPSAARIALREAVKKAKLKKRVTPHTLRHAWATHLLEVGTDSRVIQVLLGHASSRSTARYTQVSRRHIAQVKSPLDMLGTKDGAALG